MPCLRLYRGQAESLFYWKGNKVRELAQLPKARRAEIVAMRGIQRPVAQPMISPLESDHAWLARPQHRRFQRGLHRLETRIAKDRLSSGFGLWALDFGLDRRPPLKRNPTQFPRQLRLEFMRVHVPHRMEQPAHLHLSGPDHAGIGMARRRHTERSRQIQVPFSIHIPNINTLGPLPDNRPRAIRLNERNIARFVCA